MNKSQDNYKIKMLYDISRRDKSYIHTILTTEEYLFVSVIKFFGKDIIIKFNSFFNNCSILKWFVSKVLSEILSSEIKKDFLEFKIDLFLNTFFKKIYIAPTCN